MVTKVVAVLVGTSIYTFVRYVIFGSVDLVHMPVYLANKSVSMAAVVALFAASLAQARAISSQAQFWGRVSWHCVCIHILLSLAIVSKGYYSKFFQADKMNLTGEASILFGVLAAYAYWMMGSRDSHMARKRNLLLLSIVMIAGHLVAMGLAGWLNVAGWNGGMPPISLISFLLATGSFLTLVLVREKSAGQTVATEMTH